MFGALKNVGHFGEIGIVGVLGGEAGASGSLINLTSMICSTSFRLTGLTMTPLRGMTSTMPSTINRSKA